MTINQKKKLKVRSRLMIELDGRCAYCGKKDIPLEVEHIIPLSRGGTSRQSNLTLACNDCNMAKGDKTAEEFMTDFTAEEPSHNDNDTRL